MYEKFISLLKMLIFIIILSINIYIIIINNKINLIEYIINLKENENISFDASAVT